MLRRGGRGGWHTGHSACVGRRGLVAAHAPSGSKKPRGAQTPGMARKKTSGLRGGKMRESMTWITPLSTSRSADTTLAPFTCVVPVIINNKNCWGSIYFCQKKGGGCSGGPGRAQRAKRSHPSKSRIYQLRQQL